MNAYDLSRMLLSLGVETKIEALIVLSFNIMSNTSSNFALPDKTGYVRGPDAGETQNDWRKRFEMTLSYLKTVDADIICLQEVTPDFYAMLSLHSFDSSKNIFFFKYYVMYDNVGQLCTLVSKQISKTYPNVIETAKTRFSKTLGIEIQLPTKKIYVCNVHLNGNPIKSDERLEILLELARQDTIIVGDFNQSIDDFLRMPNFLDFLNAEHFTIDSVGGMTSYSRFIIDDNGYIKTVQEDSKAWQCVDNIMFDNTSFTLVNSQSVPEGGIEGKEVPYLRFGNSFTRNFITWTSDHSMQLFTLFVI